MLGERDIVFEVFGSEVAHRDRNLWQRVV